MMGQLKHSHLRRKEITLSHKSLQIRTFIHHESKCYFYYLQKKELLSQKD